MDWIKENWKMLALVALVVFVLVVVVPKLKNKLEGEQIVKKSIKGEVVPEGFAKAIHTDINKWFWDSSNPDVYTDVINLDDDDIRNVWKYWRNNLKAQNQNRDLAEAIENAQFWGSSKTEPAKLVIKLRKINLS